MVFGVNLTANESMDAFQSAATALNTTPRTGSGTTTPPADTNSLSTSKAVNVTQGEIFTVPLTDIMISPQDFVSLSASQVSWVQLYTSSKSMFWTVPQDELVGEVDAVYIQAVHSASGKKRQISDYTLSVTWSLSLPITW